MGTQATRGLKEPTRSVCEDAKEKAEEEGEKKRQAKGKKVREVTANVVDATQDITEFGSLLARLGEGSAFGGKLPGRGSTCLLVMG